jgi:hypothetical protein
VVLFTPLIKVYHNIPVSVYLENIKTCSFDMDTRLPGSHTSNWVDVMGDVCIVMFGYGSCIEELNL